MYFYGMALKANKVFTASLKGEGVVLWDTTLRPLCVQLRAYDPESRGYITIFNGLKDSGKYEFITKSGKQYIIQELTR
jgi:hypothetical protein